MPLKSMQATTMIAGMWDGVVVLAPDGVIREANPSFCAMIGFSREELIGTGTPRPYWPPEMVTQFQESYADYLSGQPGEYRLTLQRKDGTRLQVLTGSSLIKDADGRTVAYVLTVKDDTERRKAEATLHELDEVKNTFLSAVSHDLRGPIAAVLGSARTLQSLGDSLERSDRDELVGAIVRGARRLERMVVNLLDLDRLRRGAISPAGQPTDLAELVRRAAHDLDLDGGSVGMETDGAMLEVDVPMTERIVENLLVNAIRHTAPGTAVWVRIERQADGVVICVEDAGDGVPTGMREAIFEQFRQGDDEGARQGGAGIGLFIVARFAELQGGRAWVQDRPGGGASFRVFLPSAPRESTQSPAA